MTYYLIIYEDTFYNQPSEYFWTKNESRVDLFMEEYPHMKDYSKIITYDCKNDADFFNTILTEFNVVVNECAELWLMVSDHDPNVYHITTENIQDDLSTGGMTDAQYESTIHSIIKSSINLMTLSNYVRDEGFKEYLNQTILKYLSKFILLDDGTISDSIQDGDTFNMLALNIMGISPNDMKTYNEGVLSAVDYVMFVKMCEGIEP